MGFLNICNLWILLTKIVIYLVGQKCHLHGLFAVKVNVKVTSTQESVYMKTSLQIPGLTSFPSTLTAKKFMKMTFSSDKIYYNFSR